VTFQQTLVELGAGLWGTRGLLRRRGGQKILHIGDRVGENTFGRFSAADGVRELTTGAFRAHEQRVLVGRGKELYGRVYPGCGWW